MSFRKAINDMCKQCIYDRFSAGSWVKQVENCPCIDCPLYLLRPVSKSQKVPKLATFSDKEVRG